MQSEEAVRIATEITDLIQVLAFNAGTRPNAHDYKDRQADLVLWKKKLVDKLQFEILSKL